MIKTECIAMKKIAKTILDAANNSGVKWCILRKEDEIISGIENDIDLFVTSQDYPRFQDHLRSCFAKSGLAVKRERRMPTGTSLMITSIQSPLETEKLDILYDNTLAFLSIISNEWLQSQIVRGEFYPVLSKNAAAELSFRKEEARRNLPSFLRHYWFTRKDMGLWPKFYLKEYARAFLANKKKPSGAFVVLVGPDGSGKTTVGEELVRAAKPDFFSATLQHFSIPTFPRLARIAGRRRIEPDYTLPNSGSKAPIQRRSRAILYLIYYGTELLVYSHLRLSRRLRQGQLVVFDRYLHDYFFQRSYRNAPHAAISWLLARAVAPHLVVFLSGNPDLIHARKPELSAEEVETQQSLIRKNLLPFWQSRGVKVIEMDTTTIPVDETLSAIRRELTYAPNAHYST